MLNARTLQNHDGLSREYGELTRGLCEDADAMRPTLDLESPRVPPFLAKYVYPISSWPILISAEIRTTFDRIVQEVPSLIARGILAFYAGNPDGFRARYRLPPVVLQLLSEMRNELTDLVVRYDIALVECQPKLLEINVGSKCGGW